MYINYFTIFRVCPVDPITRELKFYTELREEMFQNPVLKYIQ